MEVLEQLAVSAHGEHDARLVTSPVHDEALTLRRHSRTFPAFDMRAQPPSSHPLDHYTSYSALQAVSPPVRAGGLRAPARTGGFAARTGCRCAVLCTLALA